MSWSVRFIGTPEKIAAAIEAESAKMTGQSKAEFDAAKPHLVGLAQQNFNEAGQAAPVLSLEASGSGYSRDGADVHRSCSAKIERLYGQLV